MTDDRDTPQYEPEPTDYARLPRRQEPPPALENRIVGALKEKALLQPPVRPLPWWTGPRIGLALATAVLLITVGYQIGLRQAKVSPAAPSSAMTFALFLYTETIGPPPTYPENLLGVYQEWGANLQKDGYDLIGERVMEGGAVLFIKDERLEVIELEEMNWDIEMQGYFVFQAETYDEAVKVASTNPHLKYGGLLILRELGGP